MYSTPYDTPFEIGEIPCKALVLGNREDILHPLRMAEAAAGFLPAAQFVEVFPRYTSPEKHTRDVLTQLLSFL